jgi:hypothetical protein
LEVEEVLQDRTAELRGRMITPAEATEIKERLGSDLAPATLIDWMLSYPLAGSEFYLTEIADVSKLGVDMQWLTPDQIISETTEAYPGIAAGPAGYLPVGSCLTGSGDYYYLRVRSAEDPPVVRIPHDAVDQNDGLDVDRVEIVSPRLSSFLRMAQMG